METRTVEQVRLYVLVLNTFGSAEESAIACISDSYNKIVDFYNSQLLDEPYWENGYRISFKDGPLKYFNPCPSLDLSYISVFGHGIHSEWCNIDNYYAIKNKYYFI